MIPAEKIMVTDECPFCKLKGLEQKIWTVYGS